MEDHGSPWEVEMRDGHKQTEISVVETIGGHERWSPDKGTEFLSMPRWSPWEPMGTHGSPWEVEMRDGHK